MPPPPPEHVRIVGQGNGMPGPPHFPQQRQQQHFSPEEEFMMQQRGPMGHHGQQGQHGKRLNGKTSTGPQIQDITPKPLKDDAYFRKQLTTYDVVTIKPLVSEKEDKISKKSRSKDGKKKILKWEKCTVSKALFATKDVTEKIKKLDSKRKVVDRKAALFPNQTTQIDTYLEEQNLKEMDRKFEWTLAQLEQKVVTNTAGKRQTASMTLYLKRAPRQEVDPKALFMNQQQRMQELPFQGHPNGPQRGDFHGGHGEFGGPMRPNGPGFREEGRGHGRPDQMAPEITLIDQPDGHGRHRSRGRPGQMAAEITIIEQPDGRGRRRQPPPPMVFNDRPASRSRVRSVVRGGPNGPRGRRSRSRGPVHREDYDDHSSSSSDSVFSSDEAVYDSETTPSSGSHGSQDWGRPRGRRNSTFSPLRKSRGRHAVEGGQILIDGPRRGSRRRPSRYTAPDPPRRRSFSRERVQVEPIAVEDVRNEAFAAGALAAARVAAEMPLPTPRMLSPTELEIPHRIGVVDEDFAFTRRELPLRRSIIDDGPVLTRRARDEIRDEIRDRQGYEDKLRYLEELSIHDAEDDYRRDSMVSPRSAGFAEIYHPRVPRRGTMYPLPLLSSSRTFDYRRKPPNPFAPRIRYGVPNY
jgi:hypothetical protein